ncbi:MAG: hypothetical protein MUF19_01170 [Candidatus Pacebacteria bacterium]|jgi:hypothetical protein|nr:hypothetical protein [Candidatus Paceibacterota bacterium]
MSSEILPFAELPLIPEAEAFLTDYNRLVVEHEAACREYESYLSARGINFSQLIKVLSRKKKTAELSHLGDRLQTAIRAAAGVVKSESVNPSEAMTRLVADTATMWEQRND